jgi:AraC family transcriptional regulator
MAVADVAIVGTRVFGTVVRRQIYPDAALIEVRYAPHSSLPVHAHESSLFLLTLEGRFEETVARRSRICHPGRLFYRPAGEEHAQRFHDGGSACLAIDLPPVPSADVRETDGLELAGAPALLAMRLYDEFRRPTGDTPLVVEETVARLTGARVAMSHGAPDAQPDWLERLVELIESRLAAAIRLRDLAVEADRHPVHVSRCFRHRFGCDIAEFVRRRRVHEACRRIRATDEPLSAIAATTGFSDQSHMGRAFRQVMGRSPGAYRRRSR